MSRLFKSSINFFSKTLLSQNGKFLYAHVFEEQAGAIALCDMVGKIKKMRLLRDGSEILQSNYWNLKEFAKDAFFFFDTSASDCYPLPDENNIE